jgi:hypothetical protein
MSFRSRIVTVDATHLHLLLVSHPDAVPRVQFGWGWSPPNAPSSLPDGFPERIRLSPLLTPRNLRAFADAMVKVADEMDAELEERVRAEIDAERAAAR